MHSTRAKGEILPVLPKSFCCPIIGNRVYLADKHERRPEEIPTGEYKSFSTDGVLEYIPFCDDFGPMSLSHIARFIETLQSLLDENPMSAILYCVDICPKKITNAAFLLGAYMVLEMHLSPEDTQSAFEDLEPCLLLPFRDSSYKRPDFSLQLVDCWRALALAREQGWLDQIDMDEYRHYESPLEGDLHILIPGKIVAFRGPQSLPDGRTYQDSRGHRAFAPAFYTEPFEDMGVCTVVRLSEEEEYAPAEFAVPVVAPRAVAG